MSEGAGTELKDKWVFVRGSAVAGSFGATDS